MKAKSTDDLKHELMSEDNLDCFLSDNQPYFINRSVTELLTELYEKKCISKAELARRAGMSEVYLHQVFSGRRKPSRDKMLCLCIGMDATMEETQKLLEQATYARLYPRIKREAIICHGIVHHRSLDEINDKLFIENEKTLV